MASCLSVTTYVLVVLEVVNGRVPKDCLDCLGKVKSVNGCIDVQGLRVCGPFRMTSGFFKTCAVHMTNKNYASMDFEDCATDYGCAEACVDTHHSLFEGPCLAAKNNPADTNMTCADYGAMHYDGPSGCLAKDKVSIQEYIKNMTNMCGCQTVYGKCVEQKDMAIADHKSLVIYIVPPVFGFILLIAIIVGAVYIHKFIKTRHSWRRGTQVRENKNNDESLTGRSRRNVYLCRPQSHEQVTRCETITERDMTRQDSYLQPVEGEQSITQYSDYVNKDAVSLRNVTAETKIDSTVVHRAPIPVPREPRL